MASPLCHILLGMVCLFVEEVSMDSLEECAEVVELCTECDCWKRQQRAKPFSFQLITNLEMKKNMSLVPFGWGLMWARWGGAT